MPFISRSLPVLLLSLALSTGCYTLKPVSGNFSSSATVIDNVPVRVWGDNSCGAAALSTVLNHWGDPVGESELMAMLKKGKFGGIVTVDLLLEARRRGFDAKLVPGNPAMVLRSVRDQQPVILMLKILNSPGSGVDLFHYIIVDGIDAERGLIRTQFGDGKVRWTRLEKLDRAWAGGGRATFLVKPGSAVQTPAGELSLRDAVILEESGKLREAATAYREILDKTPRSTLALTNLGNALIKLGETAEGELLYRQALEINPRLRDTLNNLAWRLLQKGDLEEAEKLARRAVDIGGADLHLVLDTLAQIQLARRDCPGALETYRHAAEAAAGQARSSMEAAREKARSSCPS